MGVKIGVGIGLDEVSFEMFFPVAVCSQKSFLFSAWWYCQIQAVRKVAKSEGAIYIHQHFGVVYMLDGKVLQEVSRILTAQEN